MNQVSNARRNLALYPWYVGAVSFFAWMPVFFLFFLSKVAFDEVLLLGSVYYLGVVFFEVPSGYFSDRFGRRRTLVYAASSLALAYAVFVLASTFWQFVIAQLLLALGLALNSGTDTSFHLANLKALDLVKEYSSREARLSSLSFASTALAALCGGALASVEVVYAYILSGAAGCLALALTLAFKPVLETDESSSMNIKESISLAMKATRQAPIGWLFFAYVVATVVNHIPYEFYQAYLSELEPSLLADGMTPLMAGIHLALVMLVAVPFARLSGSLAERLGLKKVILVSIAAQLLLVGLMAFLENWLVVFFLLLRSVPRALQDAPLRAAVAPRLSSEIRVTYLSLQSLAGRLGFAALLAVFSLPYFDGLAQVLVAALLCGIVLLAILALRAGSIRDLEKV